MIYVDQDDVAADFNSHYYALTGVPCERDSSARNDVEFWQRLEAHPRFFATMPVMPGFRELWEFLEPYKPQILTAVTRKSPSCREQKIEWWKTNFDLPEKRITCVSHRSQKVRYALPGDILIDDRENTIEEWVAAGGIGVLFRNSAQALGAMRTLLL